MACGETLENIGHIETNRGVASGQRLVIVAVAGTAALLGFAYGSFSFVDDSVVASNYGVA